MITNIYLTSPLWLILCVNEVSRHLDKHYSEHLWECFWMKLLISSHSWYYKLITNFRNLLLWGFDFPNWTFGKPSALLKYPTCANQMPQHQDCCLCPIIHKLNISLSLILCIFFNICPPGYLIRVWIKPRKAKAHTGYQSITVTQLKHMIFVFRVPSKFLSFLSYMHFIFIKDHIHPWSCLLPKSSLEQDSATLDSPKCNQLKMLEL